MTTKAKQRIEKQNSSSKRSGRCSRAFAKCRLKSLKGLQLSPLFFLKHLAEKVSQAWHLVSMKRRPSSQQPVSGAAACSKPPVSAIDSQRTEAVEDCIKYINSSSQLISSPLFTDPS